MLHKLNAKFQSLKTSDDTCAILIKKGLRLIIVGGTESWLPLKQKRCQYKTILKRLHPNIAVTAALNRQGHVELPLLY